MTATLKGFVCNNADPARVNLLAPDWIAIQFGSYCWDLTRDYGAMKWALHHFDALPAAADIQRAMLHPAYDGWHMVGTNEADLAGTPLPQLVDLITAQHDVIMAADPHARLVIECGTCQNPIYAAPAWFDGYWSAIPKNVKKDIHALNTHYYVQSVETNQANWLTLNPARKYLKNCRAHLDGALPLRELWVGEIGLAQDTYVMSNPALRDLYPSVIAAACNGYAARFAVYVMEPALNYVPLSVSGANTPYGATFAAL